MAVSLGVEFIWKTGRSCKPHSVCSWLSSYYTLPGALHEMLSLLVVNLRLYERNSQHFGEIMQHSESRYSNEF